MNGDSRSDYTHLTEAEIRAALQENTIALIRALLKLELLQVKSKVSAFFFDNRF
jgi:hypothetical protein